MSTLSPSLSQTNLARLVRKLGQAETMFASGNICTTAAYIVNSQVDLFARSGATLYRAIDEWSRRDPFLHVRLHETPNGEEFYFVEVSEQERMTRRDVKLLRLRRHRRRQVDDSDEREIWRGLVELEPTMPIDSKNRLLWRLTFLELSSSQNGDDNNKEKQHRFLAVFTFLHSIAEGRGQMRCLQELFEIFESMVHKTNDQNEHDDDDDEDIAEETTTSTSSKFEITPSLETLLVEKHGTAIKRPLPKLTDLTQKDFINKWNTTTSATTKPRFEFDNDDAFLYLDGRVYMSMADLVAKLNDSATNDTRFRPLVIDTPRYERLLAAVKSRGRGCKFNACLNMIFAIALRSLLKRVHAPPSLLSAPISYLILISHRRLLEQNNNNNNENNNEKSKTNNASGSSSNNNNNSNNKRFSSLGYFISELDFKHEKCMFVSDDDEDDDARWSDEDEAAFWTMCGEETRRTQEHVDECLLNHLDLNTAGEGGRLLVHFISSNLGLLPNSISDAKLVRIAERYIQFHMSGAYVFMLGAASIDRRLFLSILCSANNFEHAQLDYLVQAINRVIDRIINRVSGRLDADKSQQPLTTTTTTTTTNQENENAQITSF